MMCWRLSNTVSIKFARCFVFENFVLPIICRTITRLDIRFLQVVRLGYPLEFKCFLHPFLFPVDPMLTDTLANDAGKSIFCEFRILLLAERAQLVNLVCCASALASSSVCALSATARELAEVTTCLWLV